MENSATHQIDKTSLCIRVDMNMCTDWYHQHKYRHFGMDYSNTHWYLKINKKLKMRELLMIWCRLVKMRRLQSTKQRTLIRQVNEKKHVSRPISLPFWFFVFHFLFIMEGPKERGPEGDFFSVPLFGFIIFLLIFFHFVKIYQNLLFF